MKKENLESRVNEIQPVMYTKIISDRVARAERYKAKVLYAGIATAMATGVALCALYYFINN